MFGAPGLERAREILSRHYEYTGLSGELVHESALCGLVIYIVARPAVRLGVPDRYGVMELRLGIDRRAQQSKECGPRCTVIGWNGSLGYAATPYQQRQYLYNKVEESSC